MSNFSVRRYQPGDEQAILDLFNGVFAENNPNYVPRSLEHWRHIYLANPAGQEILVATDDKGEIIANYSAIPAHCSVDGVRLRSAQAVDTCVRKDWRGSLRKNSVFVTIARDYCEIFGQTNADYTNEYMWGLPNEQAFGVGTRIVGYQPVHCPMPRLFREADEAWVSGLEQAGAGVQVLASDGTDLAELSDLYARHTDQVPLGLWKDEAYLAWRYRDWPGNPYRAIKACRDGQLQAALIYRLGWMGQALVPLVDWIGRGDDRALLAALLAHVGRETLAAGGRRMETWVTPGARQWAPLQALGLTPEHSPFNLCIMVYSDRFDHARAVSSWVVTMGDSDIY